MIELGTLANDNSTIYDYVKRAKEKTNNAEIINFLKGILYYHIVEDAREKIIEKIKELESS